MNDGVLARQLFARFKALVMEPAAHAFTERHDNIDKTYKKLSERRDTSDVTDLLIPGPKSRPTSSTTCTRNYPPHHSAATNCRPSLNSPINASGGKAWEQA